MNAILACVAVVEGVICVVLLILQHDYVQCLRQMARLQDQRDRAWRAIAEIEVALPDRPSIERLAWILANARSPDACEEFDAVADAVPHLRGGLSPRREGAKGVGRG